LSLSLRLPCFHLISSKHKTIPQFAASMMLINVSGWHIVFMEKSF